MDFFKKRSGLLKHSTFVRDIVWNHKRFFLILLLSNVLAGLIALLLPILAKLQIDQLQNQSPVLFGFLYSSPLNLFIVLLLTVMAIKILRSFLDQITARIRRQIDFAASNDLEQKLLEKLETFDISFLNNPKNNSITESVFASTYFFSSILYFFEDLVRSTMSLGILPIAFFLDQTLFLIIFSFGLLETIINVFWQRYNVRMDAVVDLQNSSRAQLRWSLLQNLDRLVPMNAQEPLFRRILKDKLNAFTVSFNIDWSKDRVVLLMNLFKDLPMLLVGIVIGAKVFAGTASLGDYTMIVMYMDQLAAMFSSISWMIRHTQEIMVKMSRINFFFRLKARITVPAHPTGREILGKVEFRNLCFHYPLLDAEEKAYLKEVITVNERIMERVKSYQYDRDQLKRWQELLKDHDTPPKMVLNSVSFTLAPGEITALIGRNGAGKTTAANLIIKGYSPTDGTLLIDGVNVDDFMASELREQVAMIHQTPVFLKGLSVKENLLLGAAKAYEDDEIWDLLKKVKMKEAVACLPKGLETVFGEDTLFSGGQIQLLAIVRVILQDRKIVIFDEGTNQLDAEHEAIVMDLLKELKKTKTIFIITHKMTTARHADRIYVMDNGEIVEEGQHDTLLSQKGIYRKFWDLQVLK